LSSVRVANDALSIATAVAEAGPNLEIVVEAPSGWYWIVDWLQAQGARVYLANQSGLNWGTRRVKNERDAIDLIDMLRLGGCRTRGSRRRRRRHCSSRRTGVDRLAQ
jgi:hypothetical protein